MKSKDEITIAASEYYSRPQKRRWPVDPIDVEVHKDCGCVSLSRIRHGDDGAHIWLTYKQFDAAVAFIKSRRQPRKRRPHGTSSD